MEQSTEQWLPVVGYEGYYEVSDHGRVRAKARLVIRNNGRPLPIRAMIRSQNTTVKGYKTVTLSLMGKLRTHTIHSLVLISFVGPRPEDAVCRHLNGVPSDNRVHNLSWGTGSENQYDAVKHGHHYLASRTECPRGHKLSGLNLRQSNNSGRACRACSRERDSSTHDGRPFDVERSHLRYDDVISGRRRHKSENRL